MEKGSSYRNFELSRLKLVTKFTSNLRGGSSCRGFELAGSSQLRDCVLAQLLLIVLRIFCISSFDDHNTKK